MSIHFRSRIKSPINYTGYLFPGLNGCCCVGSSDDGSVPFKATLNECNALGGYFTVTEDDNCDKSPCLPKGSTGCCCSCSYGGMTEGIEKATCEDLDGIWKVGLCPQKKEEITFCTDPYGRNVKNKRACCGVTFEGGETYSYCENVCLARECVDNTIEGYSPKFYVNGEQCPQNCSGILDKKQIKYGDQDTGKLETDVYGNCCIQSTPCICLENLSFDVCNRLNGSFYVLGEPNYSCEDCTKNCSQEVK